MKLSALDEYGLRCLLQVAQRAHDGPVSVARIADAEGLSPEYTARLMGPLRRAGLVRAVRGRGGGYELAVSADQISIWRVVEALGGSFLSEDFCDRWSGCRGLCVHMTDCSIRALWRRVDLALRNMLEGISVADLARQEAPMVVWLETAPRPFRGAASPTHE